jgi:hypothetical protein
MFHCKTCGGKVCLMCNHTLHNDRPDHILRTYYILKTCIRYPALLVMRRRANFSSLDHSCGPTRNRTWFEVELPYALDLQLPGWQEWLKATERRLRDEYHEEVRGQSAIRSSLWTYEHMIDRCDG